MVYFSLLYGILKHIRRIRKTKLFNLHVCASDKTRMRLEGYDFHMAALNIQIDSGQRPKGSSIII